MSPTRIQGLDVANEFYVKVDNASSSIDAEAALGSLLGLSLRRRGDRLWPRDF